MQIRFGTSNSAQIEDFGLIDGECVRQVSYDERDVQSLINILNDIRHMPDEEFAEIMSRLVARREGI